MEILDNCVICLQEITQENKYKKWNCRHLFHKDCIHNWDKSCPLCNCKEIIEDIVDISWSICRNKKNYLNIESMKNNNFNLENSYINIYKNLWKDRDCVNRNHIMHYFQPYGVLVICETCNTIQCFNRLH